MSHLTFIVALQLSHCLPPNHTNHYPCLLALVIANIVVATAQSVRRHRLMAIAGWLSYGRATLMNWCEMMVETCANFERTVCSHRLDCPPFKHLGTPEPNRPYLIFILTSGSSAHKGQPICRSLVGTT
jgi:hypothetical protein